MGIVSQTEREENVESTIWINLAFKKFNCIIEMQGCAPETLIGIVGFKYWVRYQHGDVFVEFAIEIMRNQSL